MDLNTVEEVVAPRSRSELWPLRPGDAVLAGGTWLFSEPQPHVRRLVDLSSLDWPSITLSDKGIELAATCPLVEVSRLSTTLPTAQPDWASAPLFHQCCTALLASFKIWHTATVGGNLCLAFPAGAMISLAATLDGSLEVWRRDGADYRVGVPDFVTGEAANVMSHDDVLRAVHLPAPALRARTAYRKLAPSPLGRSGIVVTGRRDTPSDGGAFTIAITAATVRPHVVTFAVAPDRDALVAAHANLPEDGWTDDAHGDPDWRRAMTLVLAQQVVEELS